MQRFDLKKLTLTQFDPKAFRDASSKLELNKNAGGKPPIPLSSFSPPSNQIAGPPVPSGRTTLKLGKHRGIVSSDQEISPPSPPPPGGPSVPDSIQSSLNSITTIQAPPPPSDALISEPLPPPPAVDGQGIILNSGEDATHAVPQAVSKNPPSKKFSQKNADPNAMVPMFNVQPKYLKDAFFKACRDRGQVPSLVLRNLMKSFAGL